MRNDELGGITRQSTRDLLERVACGMILVLFLSTALITLLPGTVDAEDDPVLQYSVFGSGGGRVMGAEGESMHGTIGQPMTGRSSNAQSIVGSGFWYLWGKPPVSTGVDEEPPVPGLLPEMTRLHANAPNPFNPSTLIRFDLAGDSSVRVELFDLRGRRVDVLVDSWMSAGEHHIVYRPKGLASGTYFYRLRANGFEETRRMVLLR